jgi:hypothetical protein
VSSDAAIMLTRQRLSAFGRSMLASLLVGMPGRTQAWRDWRSRVVRVAATGGPTNPVARVLADQLSKIWGH